MDEYEFQAKMRWAAGAAIVSAVLDIPSFILGLAEARPGGAGGLVVVDRILSLVLLGMGLYLLRALSLLMHHRYETDELDAWLMGIAIVSVVAWLLGLLNPSFGLSVFILVVLGLVLIAFGVKLVLVGIEVGAPRLRALGVVEILGGVLSASVLLALLLPVVSLAGAMVEALLFLEASQPTGSIPGSSPFSVL